VALSTNFQRYRHPRRLVQSPEAAVVQGLPTAEECARVAPLWILFIRSG
jgi:hypothetical protein